jgi:photosystem II stability/assembly factor-like uncharacterized protein
MRRLFSFACAAGMAAALVTTAAPGGAAATGPIPPSYLSALRWRFIGPLRGGRALAVAGIPGNPARFYFGSVDGGVWETNDAGRTWKPIFDEVGVPSIGAIALAPSDPNVIYVGTGEADMRSDIALGRGVFKSTDGGTTWTPIGLRRTIAIGAIVVSPHDPNVVYVAALGDPYGPSAERGVFESTDGGAHWQRILYLNENTGAIDIAMDPSDPQHLLAAMWETRRPPWHVYPPSSGPSSGLYETRDGGAHWTHVTAGLPAHVGRIGISFSAANPSRVYAIVDTKDVAKGGVYRSDDGGTTWRFTAGGTAQVRIWKRGWYFGGITADPKNPDEVYVMDTSTYRSVDGGMHFVAIKGQPGGDDYHVLWIDPTDHDRMIVGGDQGVNVTLNGGKTWSSWYNQPTAQVYHIAVDDAVPYHVYGSQQDSGAFMLSSRSPYLHISARDWWPLDVGSEDGYLAPDPLHPDLVFGDGLGASAVTVSMQNVKTLQEQIIDPTLAHPHTIWRWAWTLPLVFSPADPHALYMGYQRIFRTTDGGKHWSLISPDLTREDPGIPSNLNPATAADTAGVPRPGVVYAIAPSPRKASLIWAGTDDGYVWVTRDGGAHWTNVTPPGLQPWSKITEIAASHFADGTAYVAVDRHRVDDDAPYLYVTTDYGAHWRRLDAGIPQGDFLNAISEDPKRAGLLYAGTEGGVFVSFDGGAHWQSMQLNLPVCSVRDVLAHDGDLVVATHGRGVWVLDGGAHLMRQLQGAAIASDSWLFRPAHTYRFRPGNDQGTPVTLDEPLADNPPTGVVFDYYLKERARTPVILTIRDARGRVVRTWSSAMHVMPVNPQSVDIPAWWIPPVRMPEATAGAHRYVWGFHAGDADGPLVPPGRYTVTMTVNGRSQTQPFVIERVPGVAASDADLVAQYHLASVVRERLLRVRNLRMEARHFLASASGRLTAAQREELGRDVIGIEAPLDPDNSVGVPSNATSDLLAIKGGYEALFGAIESADAAPTATMRAGLRALDAAFARIEARLHRLEGRR